MDNLAAVILAAGNSSRLGQPKQLVCWQGQTLLQRAVQAACDAGVERVFVLSGAYSEQVAANLEGFSCEQLHNPKWQEGLGGSISCAMQQVSLLLPDLDSLLMIVCDQVGLHGELLGKLVQQYEHSPKNIAASAYGAVVGTPAIFHKTYFQQLQLLQGRKGAGALIQRNLNDVLSVPFPSSFIDIDTPDDLRKLSGFQMGQNFMDWMKL